MIGKPYIVGWRDRFVERVCNWLINHIATKHYRAFIGVSTHWGVERVNEWVAAGCPDEF